MRLLNEAIRRSLERAKPLQKLGVDCRLVDITDEEQVMAAFEPFDKVFHIAALFRTEESDLNEFTRVNVGATRNLLEASRRFGVGRFVHCSTVGVQGRIEDAPASETYRTHPEDHYQQSKLEGELLAREYFKAGLPGVVVRPAGIYGPGDMRFLKVFKAIERGWFVRIGDGKTLYHFTYIDDLVDGLILASERPLACGEVFSICSEAHTTVGEFVEDVALALDKPRPRMHIPAWPMEAAARACVSICKPFRINPPLYPRRLEFFTMNRAFTIKKAREMLGYAPRVPMREGLMRTASWYKAQHLLSGLLPALLLV